jgi:5-formyltetrahydrofolate cyclo-ligase
MMSKNEIRKDALKSRRLLSAEQVELLSARVQANLQALPEYSEARVLASYVAKRDEVQTRGIIESSLSAGKRILVPRSDPARVSLSFHEIHSLDELAPGNFGVPEPPAGSEVVPLREAQLVLVPVVAWDSDGQRMGYGRGYFDMELKSRGGAVSAGLAFESQHRDTLPVTTSDVPLDMVVTDRRVHRFGRDSRD